MYRVALNGRLMDVYELDEYNQEAYGGSHVGVLVDGKIFPSLNKTEFEKGKQGFYVGEGSPFMIYNYGDDNSIEEVPHVDFNMARSITDIADINTRLLELDKSVLESVERIFKPKVQATDMPELAGLKEAICCKHIDLDKYAYRFGDNFNNDKRIFEKSSITMSKMRHMCEALDMDCYITFCDASEDTPNPIGKSITVKITNINNTDETEED